MRRPTARTNRTDVPRARTKSAPGHVHGIVDTFEADVVACMRHARMDREHAVRVVATERGYLDREAVDADASARVRTQPDIASVPVDDVNAAKRFVARRRAAGALRPEDVETLAQRLRDREEFLEAVRAMGIRLE